LRERKLFGRKTPKLRKEKMYMQLWALGMKRKRQPKYTSPESLHRWVERVLALRKRQEAEAKLRERVRRIVGPIKQTDAFTLDKY
jgi:hypothetical protein